MKCGFSMPNTDKILIKNPVTSVIPMDAVFVVKANVSEKFTGMDTVKPKYMIISIRLGGVSTYPCIILYIVSNLNNLSNNLNNNV